MSTASWRKSSSLIEKVKENPHDFTFIQIVRLLERASSLKNRETGRSPFLKSSRNSSIGFFAPPNQEAIRFRDKQTLGFPESEVSRIWKRKGDSKKEISSRQWNMVTDFFGLTGAMGVLPYHYSEFILQRIKQKDFSMQHFFDLFHHRSVSLFYRASTKYRLATEYDRVNYGNNIHRDAHTQALLSLVGMGTPHLTGRQYIPDESLIYFCGLLNQQLRTPSGLENMLAYYFDLPIRVEQFIGQWQELIPDVRTRLASRENPHGQNVCLGRNAMLGQRGWFAQGKIRINIGPLKKDQFDQLAPGTKTLKAINELTRIYLGMEHDYDLNVQVDRRDIPQSIRIGSQQKAIIGWNTWLSHQAHDKPEEQSIIDIHLSPDRVT